MATMIQPTGPAHTRMLSIGAARGDVNVPNDDIVGPIDSSDEWIRQRTGIVQRRRAVSYTHLDVYKRQASARTSRAAMQRTR